MSVCRRRRRAPSAKTAAITTTETIVAPSNNQLLAPINLSDEMVKHCDQRRPDEPVLAVAEIRAPM